MPNQVTPSRPGHAAPLRTAEAPTEPHAAQRRRLDTASAPVPGQLAGLPPRPPGPALPLTPARTQLWQWAHRPPHEMLVDNAAAVGKTGIRDDARLLATPGAVGHAAPFGAARAGELHLPSALPIPDAPRVTLPAGEPPDVAQARNLVVGWLAEARNTAAEVHAEGASPDDEADAFRKMDKLAAPAMVAALNAENPGLNLVYAHAVATGDGTRLADQRGFGSVGWNEFIETARPGRFRVVIDNDAHNMALDVAIVQRPDSPGLRGSVLALNPTPSPANTRAGIVAELADQLALPADWPLLIAEVAAQKSDRSCRIFALSMALKCQGGTFDALHQSRLLGRAGGLDLRDIDAALARPDDTDSQIDSDSDSRGVLDSSDADSDADSGARAGAGARPLPHLQAAQRQTPPVVVLGQEVMHPTRLIGPQFMKHAQSRNDVRAYIAARGADAQQAVNARQQTLMERHDAHRVVRNPAPPPPGFVGKPRGGPQIYSASIELKRISFLDKAIRHAAACEGPEVQALSMAMRAVDSRWRDRFRA